MSQFIILSVPFTVLHIYKNLICYVQNTRDTINATDIFFYFTYSTAVKSSYIYKELIFHQFYLK